LIRHEYPYRLGLSRWTLIAWESKRATIAVHITIRAIEGGEDTIDAMDLRPFGTGPRT